MAKNKSDKSEAPKTSKSSKKLKHGPNEPSPADQPKVEAPKPAVKEEPKKEPAKDTKAKPAKSETGLSLNMIATLKAMKHGNTMSHNAIAKVTGREKGNRLRELTAKGLVKTSTEEGVRGYVYSITPAGLKQLAEAK